DSINIHYDTLALKLPLPRSICQGDSLRLWCNIVGSNSNAYKFKWTPNIGLSTDTSATPIAFPSATTEYTVSVTSASGCESTAKTMIYVTDTLLLHTYIPSFFGVYPGTNQVMPIILQESAEKA